jgi:hypothetical protein
VKGRMIGTLVVALGMMVLVAWGLTSPVSADHNVAAVSSAPQMVAAAGLAEGEEEYSYVGSKKCKMCHKEQYKSWEQTKKFKTLDILKPGESAESKTKAGLDPSKDYTKDESCLECHTTGFGKKGGYAIPDPADEKAVKKAGKLAGGGCECCHGPGSAYVELHKEIKKAKRMYKVEEMYAVGLTKIEEKTCTACHNEKSPTYDPTASPFDFEKMKDDGGHDHFPLQYREG